MKRKVEENDCMLIQGLEELRRKDLNIRALEKTEQRLLSTLSQLERDVAVCFFQLFELQIPQNWDFTVIFLFSQLLFLSFHSYCFILYQLILQKMNQTKSDSDRYVKENASLIRVIGKLSSKVRKS